MKANQSEPSPDAVIDEIRQIRHLISEKCGHDPDQLVAYYLKMQLQYRGRLIGQANQPVAEKSVV
jgi:hypothetical protein